MNLFPLVLRMLYPNRPNRMYFGKLRTQILIRRSLSIDYMHSMEAYGVIICGWKLKGELLCSSVPSKSKLMISKSFIHLATVAAVTMILRTARIPRWRGLNHFTEILDVSFTDGSKYEDISKVSD